MSLPSLSTSLWNSIWISRWTAAEIGRFSSSTLFQPRIRLRSERGFLPPLLPTFFCAALSKRPWCRALAR